MKNNIPYHPKLKDVINAAAILKNVAAVTSITPSITYSKKYNSNILFKKENISQGEVV